MAHETSYSDTWNCQNFSPNTRHWGHGAKNAWHLKVDTRNTRELDVIPNLTSDARKHFTLTFDTKTPLGPIGILDLKLIKLKTSSVTELTLTDLLDQYRPVMYESGHLKSEPPLFLNPISNCFKSKSWFKSSWLCWSTYLFISDNTMTYNRSFANQCTPVNDHSPLRKLVGCDRNQKSLIQIRIRIHLFFLNSNPVSYFLALNLELNTHQHGLTSCAHQWCANPDI